MQSEQVLSFQSCFEQVEDPRVGGRCAHPLNSVLFLVVAAVISGADGPVDIENFGIEVGATTRLQSRQIIRSCWRPLKRHST